MARFSSYTSPAPVIRPRSLAGQPIVTGFLKILLFRIGWKWEENCYFKQAKVTRGGSFLQLLSGIFSRSMVKK